jgi:RNA-directed DNA polymerase
MQFMLSQLNEGYLWLCRQRKLFPPNADIWHFRRQYYAINSDLLDQINSGDYQFSPQQKIVKADGQIIHLWGSQDVLVMKLIANRLRALLPLSSRCTHIKGHGGFKQTIVEVQNSLSDYKFVCKTDVKGFYESINQYLLVEMINDTVPDANLRHYLYQIIHRCVEYGGNYRDINQGISRGCPLSPILGALYLKALDDHFTDKQLYYVRYMDDILILTKTRWQNRKAVKQLNQLLNQLKVEKHPDKTYIGRTENGFDFLGYHFKGSQLTVAAKTVEKHVLRYRQLYEQLSKKKATSDEMALALGQYVKRWQRWAVAGLAGITINLTRRCYDERHRISLALTPGTPASHKSTP